LLRNSENILRATKTIAERDDVSESNEEFLDATKTLVELFLSGGFEGIQNHLQTNVPEKEQVEVSEIYMKILQNTLEQVFADMLKTEGIQITDELSQNEIQFFQDTVLALSSFTILSIALLSGTEKF